ncbi:hypothetical protein EMIT0111MI5_60287 [Burkholderia sp. IT-111MI5]
MRLIIRTCRRLHKKIYIAKSKTIMRNFGRLAEKFNFLFKINHMTPTKANKDSPHLE